ncbi:MAG TPA: hypothetical protein VHA11_09240 [Bryobacteraceae bacterium]|nr:hypothetical protein [Bryobacteraceae bacterium]
MVLIELVAAERCTAAALARSHLARACILARVSQRWTEWDPASNLAPARVRGLPSPTILINGRPPVWPGPPDAAHRNHAVPPVEVIAAVLAAAESAAPDIPILPCPISAKPKSKRSRPRR